MDTITLRTVDIARTSDFLLRLFDLHTATQGNGEPRSGERWLYRGQQPLLRLITCQGDGLLRGAELLHHPRLHVGDYEVFRARLRALGAPYRILDNAKRGERHVLFRAPGGPLLELIFALPGERA